jgi:hypothetical protein
MAVGTAFKMIVLPMGRRSDMPNLFGSKGDLIGKVCETDSVELTQAKQL